MAEAKKADTDFCDEFLEIVRKHYGEDFDFEQFRIERGRAVDVFSFWVDGKKVVPWIFVFRKEFDEV